MSTVFKRHVWLLSGGLLVLCTAISWLLYTLFAHYIIKTLYDSAWTGIVNKILAGRAVNPLSYYYQEADRLMVVSTFYVITSFLILAFLIRNPLGVVLAFCSCLFSFSFLFVMLEVFPFLTDSMHLDFIDYYAYRRNYIPDEKLVYREKPLAHARLSNFRGHYYSPVYNIEVAPMTVDWVTDEEGFRNSHASKSSDIIVIGDSFIEYGDDEADTFGKRLEKKLSALIVTNLGKAGYGPYQYLEVLNRYGINKSPKYALLGLYEGNDISDLKEYLEWAEPDQRGQNRRLDYFETYTALTGNFLQRYNMALIGTIQYVKNQVSLLINLVISKIWQSEGFIHPEIAVLNVGNKDYKILFREIKWSQEIVKSREELLKSDELRKLKEIMSDFKTTCERNNIVPIVLYIPTRMHIYAEYSTQQSGNHWLKFWRERVRDKKNLEDAIMRLLQELYLEVINFSPEFEKAAKDGKMLYHALDSHWNAEGREMAAAFVDRVLQNRFMQPLSGK